jgi:cytochrome c biogenesis protein CcdA
MIPIGLYLMIQSQYSPARNDPFFIVIESLGIVFGFLYIPCMGALYGSIIGKLFEMVMGERPL